MKAKKTVRNMAFISLGAVCLTLCAWITVPFAIPFTLQNFGLFFLIFCFGGKCAFLSVLLYIMLGVVGIPVFSGFGGGVAYLFGPTGGFIFGFLISALIFILLEIIIKSRIILSILGSFLSLTVGYLLGTFWMIKFGNMGDSFFSVMGASVAFFIIPDVLKIIFAYITARLVSKALKSNADFTAV